MGGLCEADSLTEGLKGIQVKDLMYKSVEFGGWK